MTTAALLSELTLLARRLLDLGDIDTTACPVRGDSRGLMNPIAISVGEYTRRGPYAVGPKEPLGNARHLMMKYGLRDLPVRTEGRLVGILSDRDLRLAGSPGRVPADVLTVEDAMTTEPYAVSHDTPLGEVVSAMATRNLDSAVVLDEASIVGVFSSIDAMRALADLLDGKLSRMEKSRAPSTQPRRGPKGRAAR